MPEQTIPTATNLAIENAEGTQYGATINGKRISGITAQSRFWASVQKAITDGAVPTPYVAPPAPNPILIQLTKTDKDMARVTEDLIDTLVAKGVMTLDDLPANAKAKINNRKTLRSQL